MVGAAQAAAQKNGVWNKGGRPPTDLGVLIEALFYRLRVDGVKRGSKVQRVADQK
jgi:hypothetical protein